MLVLFEIAQARSRRFLHFYHLLSSVPDHCFSSSLKTMSLPCSFSSCHFQGFRCFFIFCALNLLLIWLPFGSSVKFTALIALQIIFTTRLKVVFQPTRALCNLFPADREALELLVKPICSLWCCFSQIV